MDDITDLLSVSANEFWSAVGSYLPSLLGAILLIIIGALLAKFTEKAIHKIAKLVRFDSLKKNKTVKKTLETTDLDVDIPSILGRVGFWVVIIIFALAAADVLGLEAMRTVIGDLLAYVPSILAGIVVLTVTIAGARLLRDAIAAALQRMSVDFARPVANVSYYVLIVFGTVMALDQLGFDTTILTNNITVIVAGVTLALAIAFGLGGKDVAGKLVQRMYDNATSHQKKK